MTIDILSYLSPDMFPEELIGEPGTSDGFGNFTPGGSPETLPCKFDGGPKTVRTPAGNEVTSNVQAIVAGLFSEKDPAKIRFTLPARFVVAAPVEALAILEESDETGPIYTEVFFP